MSFLTKIYLLLTGQKDFSKDAPPVCNELSEAACRHQPRNFLLHLFSLTASKTADGLMDPKLVLAWLLTALGSPAIFLGLLVPIREAGALLPQLFISDWLQLKSVRKWVWSFGSALQGLTVFGMAVSAATLRGEQLGWSILVLLTLFSLARSLCSVSYKDVLGKTVAKTQRGAATGSAATCASLLVLGFGVLLASPFVAVSTTNLVIALFVSSALCIIAACSFAYLYEEASNVKEQSSKTHVFKQLSLLRTDNQLLQFVITRALLVATALAPPFVIALCGGENQQLGQLGGFVIASALAATLSSYIWGRAADHSSRLVLCASAAIGMLSLIAIAALAASGNLLQSSGWLGPALLFVLMVAYQGVRLGRNTHLVDMTGEDQRAAYTAVSNSVIGVVLLLGAGFGVWAEFAGAVSVVFCFAGMCALAAIAALRLEEVQR